ncbi:MAG: FAD:protein FMN transferase [bacterium]|nr:FAD:protein FMN transferase [bacterium]
MQTDGPTMRAFEAMGTRFECVLAGIACAHDPAGRAAIAEEIERLVLDWHHALSIFDPSSTVSRINAGGQAIRVHRDLLELLDRCVAYSTATDGAFDITLGSVMAARGFRNSRPTTASSGADALDLDRANSTARLNRTGVALDLGAIAKGFVLDRCADELRDLGVSSALLHGGTSSVTAIGTTPDGSPWRIRIAEDHTGAPTVELIDNSLSVSSPSGRTVEGQGHILDPRSGRSAAGVEHACVIGPSAEVCEAWSTAIVVDPTLLDRLPSGYAAHALIDGAWRSTNNVFSVYDCSPA